MLIDVVAMCFKTELLGKIQQVPVSGKWVNACTVIPPQCLDVLLDMGPKPNGVSGEKLTEVALVFL